jgi:hypothetical protein
MAIGTMAWLGGHSREGRATAAEQSGGALSGSTISTLSARQTPVATLHWMFWMRTVAPLS